MGAQEIIGTSAEEAGIKALDSIFEHLENRSNFKLEAGAGAGKTYSLIASLNHILKNRSTYLPRADQRVACLTYTKVARDEIIRRTDKSPHVFADTLHGFLWEMISPYQKSLSEQLLQDGKWEEILDGRESLEGIRIEYDLGRRGLKDEVARLHHDDVPKLAQALFNKSKFRNLIADKFPVVFIDEYQDTPAGLIEAMLAECDRKTKTPTFGFFGDHWQQIYDGTCGSITHSSVESVDKNANFRSARNITQFLNDMRPELPQASSADASAGTVTVYHTNLWPGKRMTGQFKDQISQESVHPTLAWVRNTVQNSVWVDATQDLKILMLTHTSIANEIGYSSLAAAFKRNESFAKKEDRLVEYLIDTIEPACAAYQDRKYGALFEALSRSRPHLKSPAEKQTWVSLFEQLGELRSKGTVGEVVDLLLGQSLFSVPESVTSRHHRWLEYLNVIDSGEVVDKPRSIADYEQFRLVQYTELQALAEYLEDSTLFSTKHSVKGAEFDDVIVVLGRGWSHYNFAAMLDNYERRQDLVDREKKAFERARNLFYVACSRAKQNLTLVFTQELSDRGLNLLESWAGTGRVIAVKFSDELTPC